MLVSCLRENLALPIPSEGMYAEGNKYYPLDFLGVFSGSYYFSKSSAFKALENTGFLLGLSITYTVHKVPNAKGEVTALQQTSARQDLGAVSGKPSRTKIVVTVISGEQLAQAAFQRPH